MNKISASENIGLPGRDRCTGCGACAAVCPRAALAMHPDDEGFMQPSVDMAACVRCGLCASTCPVNHPFPMREPVSVWAAQSRDANEREASSSGGIFSLLARSVLDEGGVVFGAAFVGGETGCAHQSVGQWRVCHIEVSDVARLSVLRGSKYVQSDLDNSFQLVCERLRSGRRVLFAGTPCQTAGLSASLRVLLGAEFEALRERLLLVSVICHAAPSPRAWLAYLDEEFGKGEVAAVSFRDKGNGWKRYTLKVLRSNGSSSSATCEEHPFLRAFLSELCNRRSCARCKSRSLRTDDDMMLGDYWSVASRFPDLDDDRGTSLVLVNSSRGEEAWRSISPFVRMIASDWGHAQAVNPALVKSTPYGPNRDRFFSNVGRMRFSRLVESSLQPPWHTRVKCHLARLKNVLALRKRTS